MNPEQVKTIEELRAFLKNEYMNNILLKFDKELTPKNADKFANFVTGVVRDIVNRHKVDTSDLETVRKLCENAFKSSSEIKTERLRGRVLAYPDFNTWTRKYLPNEEGK